METMKDVVSTLGDAITVYDQGKKAWGSGTEVVKEEPIFLRIGGCFGAVALLAAAYGVYDPELQNNLQRRQIYKNGYKMQLVHSVALGLSDNCNKPRLTGRLFMLGIVLYSGSSYVHAKLGDARFRYVTYVGQGVLVFAWLSMLL